MASSKSEHYHAIVDMGSNGIRFSITDLTPATARIMPTIYQDRSGISLYDAQWSTGQKGPIPDTVTKDVVRSLQRFKRTCADFGVPDTNVRILATEATRQAINSEEYRASIKETTGWTVEMLPKDEEGRVGAMGVVSSFDRVKGLMMDLGGGSTQITWLIAEDGAVKMSEAGSVSMPYGAAALMRQLAEATKLGGKESARLRDEITANLKDAVAQIKIPQEMLDSRHSPDGLTLYLSGGGFRGWGFVLMSQHPVSPYPIPIINGFKTSIQNFKNTQDVISAATSSDEDIFRVSERRASQVPAVALLVNCMIDALPAITTVRFAQGGVREGSLFTSLSADTKSQHPLVTATIPHGTSSTPSLLHLLRAADPDGIASATSDTSHATISGALLTALSQSLYIHSPLNKDLKAAAALRSTTTGSLASVHGASHDERAALGVMLCERWGGLADLSPGEATFIHRLRRLLGAEAAWWCTYYGRVAAVISEVYPAGIVRSTKLSIAASWTTDRKDRRILSIAFDFGVDEDANLMAEPVQKALKAVEKLGKKKNWPDEEWGCKVEMIVKGGGI